jgi:hypothetical protein
MEVPSPRRAEFVPDALGSVDVEGVPEQEAPALSSSCALARFEFESGRGNEGTKILMVEWSDSETEGSTNMGDWEVAWEGKTTTLSAKDGAEGKLHRLYFLLAPGASVPRIVKLSQKGGRKMQTNPLPAIFPPELGISATTQGKKGVLHTIWAKKRLSVLQKEIDHELKTNGEGVGLEMAMQEKQWIEENFGVGSRVIPDIGYTASPTSPKTPGGGRLSEKLRGLGLRTGSSELSMSTSTVSTGRSPSDFYKSDHKLNPTLDQPPSTFDGRSNNPLSPDLGDVAVSSFSLFHGGTSRPQRAVAHSPPQALIAKQNDPSYNNSRVSSLNAIASGHVSEVDTETETEDELFAVKMSPRSPEMKKSPFSFTAKDTKRYE